MLISASRLLTRATRPVPCAACQSQRRLAHKLVEVELIVDVPSLGRRGSRAIVSPGRARNQLIPQGQALYVVADKGVSSLRDMRIREESRAIGAVGRTMQASQVLDEMTENTSEDAALSLERSLLDALTLLPQPLSFHRLTTSSDARHLFGSVSAADIISEAKEFGIRLDESQGAFEETEGVEKGRVKSLGNFVFNVQLKALGESFPISVEVLKEDSAAAPASKE